MTETRSIWDSVLMIASFTLVFAVSYSISLFLIFPWIHIVDSILGFPLIRKHNIKNGYFSFYRHLPKIRQIKKYARGTQRSLLLMVRYMAVAALIVWAFWLITFVVTLLTKAWAA